MTQTLHIGRGLTLPLGAVTLTFGILAKRRVGKTYTASVMAEEFADAGIPFVALDPTGAWWGLRSSATGKRGGIPVIILGGAHGDVPLERTGGKLVADLVVDHPGFYVLDLESFESNAAQDQFVTDFLERLYRRKAKKRDPLHVFIDEADSFAPQRPGHGQLRMLGATEAVVRRGGIRGIGTTLITQRSAVLNKNVLSQLDVLIALQTTGPQDIEAIRGWTKSHGTKEQEDQMLGSVASLGRGEAWVWSPGPLVEIFQRVTIRERRTFNSSATPELGAAAIEPTKLATVNLDAIRSAMAATIEKQKADDPGELRKRIAALEAELAKERRAVASLEETAKHRKAEHIEVPVLKPEEREALVEIVGIFRAEMAQFAADLRRVGDLLDRPAVQRAGPARDPLLLPLRKGESREGVNPHAIPHTRPLKHAGHIAGNSHLRAGAVRILRELAARYPAGYSRSQVGVLTRFSPRGGTFNTYLGDLRKVGYIEEPDGLVYATEAGIAWVGADIPQAPTSHDEAMAMWRGALRAGAFRMLQAVVAAGNGGISRDAIADAVGMEKTGGTFSTYLGDLRRNALITERDGIAIANDILFP